MSYANKKQKRMERLAEEAWRLTKEYASQLSQEQRETLLNHQLTQAWDWLHNLPDEKREAELNQAIDLALERIDETVNADRDTSNDDFLYKMVFPQRDEKYGNNRRRK